MVVGGGGRRGVVLNPQCESWVGEKGAARERDGGEGGERRREWRWKEGVGVREVGGGG